MNSQINVLATGINSGLLFIPFAIGIGLIYHNLKEIDVSIDGVVILSGIGAALLWNTTQSYICSIAGGMLVGILCSAIVSSIQTILAVQPLMSGLVFSLIAHTVSIYLIGESVTLRKTKLILAAAGQFDIQLWHVALLAFCYLIPIYIYNSHLGMSIRKLGNNVLANLSYPEIRLKSIAYSISGGIYGIGAAIFVHSSGMAGGGVGFEYLVQALTGYLLVGKIMPWVLNGISKITESLKRENIPYQIKKIEGWISFVMSAESLKAPIGAVCLEIIVAYVIFTNPEQNPQFWKLSLSIVLLVVLSTKPEFKKLLNHPVNRLHDFKNGIKISALDFQFVHALGIRNIFSKVDVFFPSGLNILSGANGSGKTTLLKLIAGEHAPISGNIYFDDKELSNTPRHSRSVFLLTQNPLETLIREMSVTQNLFLASKVTTAFSLYQKNITLRRLLGQLRASGISIIREDDESFWQRPISSLSGGEAYCVAIYCAVLSCRLVILADEPTTGLDTENYGMVRDALNSLSTSNEYTVIIVTHDDRLKDISWNKYSIRNQKIEAESDWWDARFPNTFFPKVYKLGDKSFEGHVVGSKLDLFARTQREVNYLKDIIGNLEKTKILDCPCGYGKHS